MRADSPENRILVVAGVKFDQQSGAQIRLAGLIKILKEKYEVRTLFIDDVTGTHVASQPPGFFLRMLSILAIRWKPPWLKRLVSNIFQKHIDEFAPDLVVISHYLTADWLLQRLDLLGCPVIVDAYDILWQSVAQAINQRHKGIAQKILNYLTVSAARRIECGRYLQAAELWVCSESDAKEVKDICRYQSVHVVPNFYPEQSNKSRHYTSTNHNTLLFIGWMKYEPNYEGMRWFLRECWRHLRNQIADLRLIIAGAWDTNRLPVTSEFIQEGVEIMGYVADTTTLWEQATVFICPLLRGTGTRIKILEAWANCVPVISTAVGIGGLICIPGQHALVVMSAHEMIEAVIKLLKNPELRLKLSCNGYQIWKQNYMPDIVGTLVHHYISALLAPESPRESPSQLAILQ